MYAHAVSSLGVWMQVIMYKKIKVALPDFYKKVQHDFGSIYKQNHGHI